MSGHRGFATELEERPDGLYATFSGVPVKTQLCANFAEDTRRREEAWTRFRNSGALIAAEPHRFAPRR